MTELRDDLDRALRSVTFGEAPVQRAMRDGRRLRNRRRLAVLAGALAIAAAAVASPSFARLAAAPPVPATSHPVTPRPSLTHGDPVVTDQPPAPGAAPGTVAQGTIGGARWTAELNPQGQGSTCFTASTALAATGPASQVTAELTMNCAASGQDLVSSTGSDPAGFTGSICSATADGTAQQVMLGAVAPDVTYLVLAFTDGQQLKLIPVTLQGHRYVAWVAPASMNVASLTAHLGGPHSDNGQTVTANPFEPPGGDVPQFGLWLKPGQAGPPRAAGVIGHGTGDGRPWSASGYEGPWGTCIVTNPGGDYCVQFNLAATAVLGGWGGDAPGPAFGSAAPGVASLRVSLSNGKSVQVKPVSVGDARLFACWIGDGVSPTGWTSYDAAGRVTGTGSMTPSSASGTVTLR
jgi:hypothetical protein